MRSPAKLDFSKRKCEQKVGAYDSLEKTSDEEGQAESSDTSSREAKDERGQLVRGEMQ